MESKCTNSGVSSYFHCRILASKYNENLKSRESASEYLGVSVSSLANYERGITVPPLDLVIMMADIYNAPQLKNLYCMNECILGKEQSISAQLKTLETVTISIISKLDEKKVNDMKKQLLQIAEDGKVNSDEEEDFNEISATLDNLAVAISELKLLKQKIQKKR